MSDMLSPVLARESYSGEPQDLIVDLVNALSAVKSLSDISCEIGDERTVIRLALSCLISNQDIERCSFFILNDDDTLSNVTGISMGERAQEQTSDSYVSTDFRVGEGIVGTAAATGEMQYCEDCRNDKRFTEIANKDNMPGSIICTPVFTLHKELIGVLNVSHPEPKFFTVWHERLLQVFSNIFGQLITNRRLFQQMESEIAHRTRELERLVEETGRLKDYYASMSMEDQLTGLHNRRYFYEQVELALAQHKRYNYPFCLLMMDIDHFKSINDCYGHAFGDDVLVTVAAALNGLVRTTDILVRFGGEEFVLIFVNTSCDNGKSFAERIRESVKALTWQHEGVDVHVTISIGLYCLVPSPGAEEQVTDIDQIVHCADTALYRAKVNGRDRVEVYCAC
jgi:diguanylate cyclase (GGDEF)-like protein